MMRYTQDDLIASVVTYLRTSPVELKDITGAAKSVTGALTRVYSDLTIEPAGLRDMESAPVPYIVLGRVTKRISGSVFGARSSSWALSLEAQLTAQAGGSPDHELSLARAYAVSGALQSLFDVGAEIPLLVHYFDGSAPEPAGSLEVAAYDSSLGADYTLAGSLLVRAPYAGV
jgi:hypothetical protein